MIVLEAESAGFDARTCALARPAQAVDGMVASVAVVERKLRKQTARLEAATLEQREKATRTFDLARHPDWPGIPFQEEQL